MPILQAPVVQLVDTLYPYPLDKTDTFGVYHYPRLPIFQKRCHYHSEAKINSSTCTITTETTFMSVNSLEK